MIRKLELICCECQKPFVPEGELFYRDNFISNNIKDVKFICPECLKNWKNKWQIQSAEFYEKDYSIYVNIILEDGTEFKNLDCTALDGVVITSEEIPLEGQEKLYSIYEQWDLKRKQNTLKDCIFKDEFMRTTFSCETYGGEKYVDVAFRFNMQGKLETAEPLPDYIIEQIITAWKMYEANNID